MSEIKLGDLSPTRDLVYVSDTARGFHEIAKCSELIGQDCNIATQTEISISRLANSIIDQINPNVEIICDQERIRPEKSEVYRLYGSAEKLLKYTSWKPEMSLDEGIRKTINWFKKEGVLLKYKADIYNK